MPVPINLLRWRGTWVNGTIYNNYDVVLSPANGGAYVLNNGNSLVSVVDPSLDPLWVALGGSSPPPTQPSISYFDYQDYTPVGLLPLPDDPARVTTNTLTITPPTNGTLYMETIARCIGTQTGGSAVFSFSVNGTPVSDPTPAVAQAYAGNINFLIATMFQINVTAGTPYTIEVRGGCSALPPGTPDALCASSRLMCLFTPV